MTNIDKEKFNKNGYLVLNNFISDDECQVLIDRATKIVLKYKSDKHIKFYSKNNSINSDKYFLDSANNISIFFEELALDENNNLRQPILLSVNKLGHALHEKDPVFKNFSNSQSLSSICSQLDMNIPFCIQSMYIFKQPRIGGEVTYHQDATFLYTEPSSVIGFWWALEDATINNGCLWVLPKGHKDYKLRKRFIRKKDGKMDYNIFDHKPWLSSKFIPLEVKKGTLIILDGLLPHGSSENHSKKSRHAYSLHFVDNSKSYPQDNWLQKDIT